jgi:hypothetical protein
MDQSASDISTRHCPACPGNPSCGSMDHPDEPGGDGGEVIALKSETV